MNIIIPMAGLGSRFKDEGFELPKPLIEVNNKTLIVDVLSDFIQNWLEDNLNPELFDRMNLTVGSIPTKQTFEEETIKTFSTLFEKRIESFEDQLSKFQTV